MKAILLLPWHTVRAFYYDLTVARLLETDPQNDAINSNSRKAMESHAWVSSWKATAAPDWVVAYMDLVAMLVAVVILLWVVVGPLPAAIVSQICRPG